MNEVRERNQRVDKKESTQRSKNGQRIEGFEH